MYFWYIWQTFPTGITIKELTNVEIQEQTASFWVTSHLNEWTHKETSMILKWIEKD